MAEKEAFDRQVFKKAVEEKTNARLKMWLEICAHCGLCADTCHFYLANEKDPNMIPAVKGKKVLEAFKKKDKIDEDWLEDFYWTVYGECTMCRRCTISTLWRLWRPGSVTGASCGCATKRARHTMHAGSSCRTRMQITVAMCAPVCCDGSFRPDGQATAQAGLSTSWPVACQPTKHETQQSLQGIGYDARRLEQRVCARRWLAYDADGCRWRSDADD